MVDLGLPDGDGTDLLRKLASGRPGIATLVLSASVDEAPLARTVSSGARAVSSLGIIISFPKVIL